MLLLVFFSFFIESLRMFWWNEPNLHFQFLRPLVNWPQPSCFRLFLICGLLGVMVHGANYDKGASDVNDHKPEVHRQWSPCTSSSLFSKPQVSGGRFAGDSF